MNSIQTTVSGMTEFSRGYNKRTQVTMRGRKCYELGEKVRFPVIQGVDRWLWRRWDLTRTDVLINGYPPIFVLPYQFSPLSIIIKLPIFFSTHMIFFIEA